MRGERREEGKTGGREPREDFIAKALHVLKRVTGMPDYAGYLEHMAERHAGCAVLSEREFFDQYVNARYGNGASRCC